MMSTRRFARSAALVSVAAVVVAIGAWALRPRRRPTVAVELPPQDMPKQRVVPVVSTEQRALMIFLTLIAVGLMALSAWRFVAASNNDDAILEGGVAFLFGAATVALARKSSQALPLNPSPRRRGVQDKTENGITEANATVATETGRIRWPYVVSGVALLVLVAAASNDANLPLAMTFGARGQYLFWVIGIMAVAWGLSGARRLSLPRLDRREAALLAVILLVTLSLRVYGLDQLRVLVDETHFSTGALYFLKTSGPQMLRPIGEYDPFPRIATYWVAEATVLFGHTLFALRIVPALVGTATVAAIYLLGRELFDRRVGLAAAALLATLPPFLHFSRLGVISIIDPLFGTLALAFLARALRRNSRAAYVRAGIMLGLTQYFHEAGKLTFPVLILLWLIGLALTKTHIHYVKGTSFGLKVDWPFAWRGLALGLLAALIVAAPLVITERTQPEQIRTRLNYAVLPGEYWRAMLLTSDFRPQLARTWEAAMAFVRLRDATKYYGDGLPLVLPVFVPLLLLGIAWVVRQRPARGGSVVLVWIMLTVLGNSILTETTTSVHFIIAMPAAALLMALGLNDTLLRLTRRHAAALLAVGVIAVSAGQAYYYFGPHLEIYNALMRAIGQSDAYDTLLRAAELPPGTNVHLIVEPTSLDFDQEYAQEVMRYFNDRIRIDVSAPDDVDDAYLDHLSHRVPQAFFFKPSAFGAGERIVRAFPSDHQPEPSPYLTTGETYLLYLVLPQAAGS